MPDKDDEINQPPPQSLRQTAMGGVATAAVSTFIQIGSQVLGLAILARILTPSDFGVTAPSIAIATFLALLAEFGFGSNLIQRVNMTAVDVGSAIIFALTNAFVLSLIVILFLDPLTHLIHLTQPGILVFSLGIIFLVPTATILESVNLKRFRFRRSLVAGVVSSMMGSLIVPVALALAGAGIWSIVAGQLVSPLVKVIIFAIYMRPNRIPRGSITAVHGMLTFSTYFTASRILSMISLQGDRVVLSNVLLPASLGFYTRAQNFSQLIITFLTSAFEKALFPLLTSIQHDHDKTKKVYMEVFFMVSTFTGLAAVGAATTSYALMHILLGSQWVGAAPVASVFSTMIFLRCTDRLAAILLRSNNMLKERAVLQVFLAVGTLASCFAFGRVSLISVVWSIVACNSLGFIYTQVVIAGFLKIRVGEVLEAFARSAMIAGIYVAIFYLVENIFPPALALELRQLLQAGIALTMTLGFVFVVRQRLLNPSTLLLLASMRRRFAGAR